MWLDIITRTSKRGCSYLKNRSKVKLNDEEEWCEQKGI